VKVRVWAVAASAALGIAGLANVTPANAAPVTYNVRDYGARGNGSTLDDDAIDRAITAASTAGGGIVVFPAGTYQSRTIHLKSDVTLQLDSGATIRAASRGFDASEANPYSQYQDYGHSHFHNSLMWGDGISNFAITGSGTIDGDGLTTDNAVPSGVGDKTLVLTRCSPTAATT
jgi:polygalacturonase